MNIKDYDSYFHDGTIIDVENIKDGLILSLSSAELIPEENLDKIPLAKYNRIRGRLFIKKINKTTTSGKKQLEPMIQRHDYAELYNLEILDKKVVICGQWVDDTSENNRNALYFNHEIFADEIYWETDPSIIDPFLDYPP